MQSPVLFCLRSRCAHLFTALVVFAMLDMPAHADVSKENGPPKRNRRPWVPKGELDQDFPYVTACIGANIPAGNKAYKGIALKVGSDAYMCFDTDLLRMSAGWTGGYLNFIGVTFNGSHGDHPTIAGDQKFGTSVIPGVADASGEFADTRAEKFGPISENLGRWNGLYIDGDDVVLSYTVSGTKILEYPTSTTVDGHVGFIRNFQIEKPKAAFSLLLCEVDSATGTVAKNEAVLAGKDGMLTRVALLGAPKGVALQVTDGRLSLKVPAKTAASLFKVVIWHGKDSERLAFATLTTGTGEMPNITTPGTRRWPEVVTTKGMLNFDKTPDGAYAVDQLTPPVDNPWKRRVRFAGLDFFADGKRAALSTWDGDVWIVSGIDDKLEKLAWKRFASGGYETLGLKIVDDVIYTSGRDQITRYHDFNQDGECDYYENFNNQITSSDGFHEFVFDLHTDKDGNFYTVKAGPVRGGGRGFGGDNFGSVSAHAGTMMKISKDGSKLEVIATGFRAPNGMGIGPNGELTTGDNEGTWVPTCPLNMVEPGGFYGVETLAHKEEIPPYKQPLCWMSHQEIDNSGGGQVWATSDKWGPLQNQLFHMSYGKCTLYLVMKEKLFGQWQGGVVKVPLRFTSSTMRARFNPLDGQMYVCGLQGWQTSAAKITGFDRVRYTGKPIYSVFDLQIRKGIVRLTFTQPLDPEYANDPENYSVKRWNYNRSGEYGSPEVSVADPKAHDRDDVAIERATLSPDGKTVSLQLVDLRPVMQQSISFDLKARDGTPIKQYIQHTINVVP